MTLPLKPLDRPDRESVRVIRHYAEQVAHGKENAHDVARLAVHVGFMLIGTLVSKKVHYPVIPRQHRHGDLRAHENSYIVEPEALGRKTLQVSRQTEIALITGIYGDANDYRQRKQLVRRLGLTENTPESRFGWGHNEHKTRSQGIIAHEEAHVLTHAAPQLINAALDPDLAWEGAIDLVYPHPSCVRIARDIGQWLCMAPRRTIISIPLMSNSDLPYDIVPTKYPTPESPRYE